MRRRKRRQRPDDLVTATELAAFVYCPEDWRPEHGLGLEAANHQERAAGTRHHRRKALAERLAGGSLAAGRWMAVIALLGLLWLWWQSR